MIDSYWVVSPSTPVELPEGDLRMPAGVVDIVGGGWYAMIEPLAPGTHTIVVHGETDYPDDEEGPPGGRDGRDGRGGRSRGRGHERRAKRGGD